VNPASSRIGQTQEPGHCGFSPLSNPTVASFASSTG
jgi:hypothetical protein